MFKTYRYNIKKELSHGIDVSFSCFSPQHSILRSIPMAVGCPTEFPGSNCRTFCLFILLMGLLWEEYWFAVSSSSGPGEGAGGG